MNDSAASRNVLPPRSGRRVGREPGWRLHRRFTTAELHPEVRRWLLDDGSLTGRLIEQRRGRFAVRRLFQGWETPLPSEQRLLELKQREVALVREVLLMQGDQGVVFARSVVPLSTLSGNLAHLRRLRTRPLGAILFSDPGMRRSPFELARIGGNSDYLPAPLRQPGDAWARRSRFDMGGRSVMVSEVFLAHFRPWAAVLPVHRTQRGKVSAAIVRPKQ